MRARLLALLGALFGLPRVAGLAARGRRHGHYFKGVSHLTEVDVYMVCELFQVNDPSGATQHAIKKLLLPGQRGAGKSRLQDLREARDTLDRRIEILVICTGDGTKQVDSLSTT